MLNSMMFIFFLNNIFNLINQLKIKKMRKIDDTSTIELWTLKITNH